MTGLGSGAVHGDPRPWYRGRMSAPFRATVRQVYRLNDTQLVVLRDGYEGDVGPGDEIELQLQEGTAKAKVVDLAWGSAFQATEPPLTLIVKGLPEGAEPAEEAWVKTSS